MGASLIPSLAAGPHLVIAALRQLAEVLRGDPVSDETAALINVGRWLIFAGACSIGWSIWHWATRSDN